MPRVSKKSSPEIGDLAIYLLECTPGYGNIGIVVRVDVLAADLAVYWLENGETTRHDFSWFQRHDHYAELYR